MTHADKWRGQPLRFYGDLTAQQYKHLLAIFDRGLCSGIGDEHVTCLEGAIASVVDGHLTDEPSCVAAADRSWGMVINDAPWSGPMARAAALLPVAVAQIGTAGRNRSAWSQRVALGTMRRVLPVALDAIGLESYATRCREATDDDAAAASCEAVKAARAARITENDADAPEALLRRLQRRLPTRFDYVVDVAAAVHQAVRDAAVAREDADAAAATRAAVAAAGAAVLGDVVGGGLQQAVLRDAVAIALDAYDAEGRHATKEMYR